MTQKTDGGGAVTEYPDVRLTEKPPAGIWLTSVVLEELIVRPSPLTVLLISDEEAQRSAAESEEHRRALGTLAANSLGWGRAPDRCRDAGLLEHILPRNPFQGGTGTGKFLTDAEELRDKLRTAGI